MLNFAESGHPASRASSALERGELKSKGKGVEIHSLLPTTTPANQLSVHGAVAEVCKGLARDSRGTVKPAPNENLKSMVTPTESSTANPISQTAAEVQRKLVA